MKILHISTSDSKGGSAKSAYRIHSSLLSAGYDSKMLVGRLTRDDTTISSVYKYKISMYLNYMISEIFSLIGFQYYWLPISYLFNHAWLKEADIIQIYNMHGGYLPVSFLDKINKPVVIRFSDMWYLTGHCAYPGDCNQWESGCISCESLDSYPSIGIDKSRGLLSNKKKLLSFHKFSFVAPSSWMKTNVEKSVIIGDREVMLIHNSVDEKIYKTRDRKVCREYLSINEREVVLLCVSHGFSDNPRKGLHFLYKSLDLLDTTLKNKVTLYIVGEYDDEILVYRHINIVITGYVESEVLSQYYASADLTVIPSVEDNLPNVIIESLACGTPTVANNVGGMHDAVEHLSTGYLVDPTKPDDFADGIMFVLDNLSNKLDVKDYIVGFYNRKFSNKQETSGFLNLYRDLLVDNK